MTTGVDVSHYQTSEKVAAAIKAGARFIIAKATQGTTGVDPAHNQHVATARAGRALVGHYHFAQAVHEAPAELEHFLTVAAPKNGDAIALDMESMDGSWAQRLAYGLTWTSLARARTFCWPLLYMNLSWFSELSKVATVEQRAQLRALPLWIATGGRPAGQPGITGWSMHQYSTADAIDHDLLAPGVAWSDFAIPTQGPHHKPPAPTPAPEDHDMAIKPAITEYNEPDVPTPVPDALFLVDMTACTRTWLPDQDAVDDALALGAVMRPISPKFMAGTTRLGPIPK